jgi:hypothetical protein
MSKALVILCAALVLLPIGAAAQDDQATTPKPAQDPTAQLAIPPPKGPPATSDRFVRTLTNVQIELTLTDQLGNAAAEKKTVTMIVASGNWGKIRNTAARSGPFQVGLNVDARPLVSVDGPIQLELTIYYYPPQGRPEAVPPVLPTELNQSMTIVLQSGKPMLISQSADPASDRKVSVEVKATILK